MHWEKDRCLTQSYDKSPNIIRKRKSRDNIQTPPETSTTLPLRTDLGWLGWSVGVTTVNPLVRSNRFTSAQPSQDDWPIPQRVYISQTHFIKTLSNLFFSTIMNIDETLRIIMEHKWTDDLPLGREQEHQLIYKWHISLPNCEMLN